MALEAPIVLANWDRDKPDRNYCADGEDVKAWYRTVFLTRDDVWWQFRAPLGAQVLLITALRHDPLEDGEQAALVYFPGSMSPTIAPPEPVIVPGATLIPIGADPRFLWLDQAVFSLLKSGNAKCPVSLEFYDNPRAPEVRAWLPIWP